MYYVILRLLACVNDRTISRFLRSRNTHTIPNLQFSPTPAPPHPHPPTTLPPPPPTFPQKPKQKDWHPPDGFILGLWTLILLVFFKTYGMKHLKHIFWGLSIYIPGYVRTWRRRLGAFAHGILAIRRGVWQASSPKDVWHHNRLARGRCDTVGALFMFACKLWNVNIWILSQICCEKGLHLSWY